MALFGISGCGETKPYQRRTLQKVVETPPADDVLDLDQEADDDEELPDDEIDAEPGSLEFMESERPIKRGGVPINP